MAAQQGRLRLGHISYSNCFPVHGRFIDQPRSWDPQLIEGTPAVLNGLLVRGEIDAAPSSSIEYARHADRYSIIPGHVIGARGRVRSIIFSSRLDPARLTGRTVALPTASATSVVLLKVLLRERWRSEPRFVWFDQAVEDPFEKGASAALYIGDVALGLSHPAEGEAFDLGTEWFAHTALPFAFAVWQTTAPREAAIGLHRQLDESKTFCAANLERLAARYADHFGMPAEALHRYWETLQYDLDREMVEGLETFYRLAKEVGELPEVPDIRWVG